MWAGERAEHVADVPCDISSPPTGAATPRVPYHSCGDRRFRRRASNSVTLTASDAKASAKVDEQADAQADAQAEGVYSAHHHRAGAVRSVRRDCWQPGLQPPLHGRSVVYGPLQAGHVQKEQRLVLAVRAVTCQRCTISSSRMQQAHMRGDCLPSAGLPSSYIHVCVVMHMLVRPLRRTPAKPHGTLA